MSPRRPGRPPLRAPLERDLESWLQKWLHSLEEAFPGRLLAYHTRRSTGSPAGFPDWAFVGRGGFALRELKRPGGKLSADQQAWFAMLRSAGIDVAMWTEDDRYTGRISAELRRLAGFGIAARDDLGGPI